MKAWDWAWVPSTPRRVDFEYESLEDIVCHLYELGSLNISAFEGAPRKTLYIDFVKPKQGADSGRFRDHHSQDFKPSLFYGVQSGPQPYLAVPPIFGNYLIAER